MADRLRPAEMTQLRFLRVHFTWRASLIVIGLLAVILLPVWGSAVARIQSATFPYPGLEMDYRSLAVSRLDSVPTCANITVVATFLDLYSYGGKLLLKVSEVIHDVRTVTVERFIDVKTRQEYVTQAAAGGNAVVSAAVYTVLFLPKVIFPGQMIQVNSFTGQLQGPVKVDAFGQTLPMGSAYVVRTAEGSFYYTLDTHVLQEYESNVAVSANCVPSRGTVPTPLRSLTLMTFNDVASRGTMQGLLASLGVLLAVGIVFALHRDIDHRRLRRLEGMQNRIRSLSNTLEDQYLLGFISRETYMRRQVVLRRLAAEIEIESQTRPNNRRGVPPLADEDISAP